jgi:hypothetical protein
MTSKLFEKLYSAFTNKYDLPGRDLNLDQDRDAWRQRWGLNGRQE